MTREQLEAKIKSLNESIKAGMDWDKANGHKGYEYSAQCSTDKAELRVTKKKLRSLNDTAPKMAYVGIGRMA